MKVMGKPPGSNPSGAAWEVWDRSLAPGAGIVASSQKHQ